MNMIVAAIIIDFEQSYGHFDPSRINNNKHKIVNFLFIVAILSLIQQSGFLAKARLASAKHPRRKLVLKNSKKRSKINFKCSYVSTAIMN